MYREKNWAAVVLFSVSAALKVSLLLMLYSMHHETGTINDTLTNNHHHISSVH